MLPALLALQKLQMATRIKAQQGSGMYGVKQTAYKFMSASSQKLIGPAGMVVAQALPAELGSPGA